MVVRLRKSIEYSGVRRPLSFELPFEQAMRFDFVVNLKTARSLKIKLPESFLVRATDIIK